MYFLYLLSRFISKASLAPSAFWQRRHFLKGTACISVTNPLRHYGGPSTCVCVWTVYVFCLWCKRHTKAESLRSVLLAHCASPIVLRLLADGMYLFLPCCSSLFNTYHHVCMDSSLEDNSRSSLGAFWTNMSKWQCPRVSWQRHLSWETQVIYSHRSNSVQHSSNECLCVVLQSTETFQITFAVSAGFVCKSD